MIERVAVAVLAAAAAAACSQRTPSPPPPPPPEVETVPVVQRDVPLVTEWIGTLDGSVNADIRPKVEGYVRRQVYHEGQYVRRGAVLFEIDPRQFRASVEQARGLVGQAQAQLDKATRDVERFTPLAAERAISQQELDNALSAQRNAKAAVDAARAAADQAALSLGWTRVTSPIDGIVGAARHQVGDLVNSLTVMTTVSTVDPIRVTFGISEREYMRYATRFNASGTAGAPGAVLHLVLDDGTVFPRPGRVVFTDREVDAKTGTMTVKGVFPNPGNVLRPGQYGRVRAELDIQKDALLVPQRAVSELQGGFRVAVVKADNTVEMRPVETGPRVGPLWVIEKGVRADEKVVVAGLQFVRPGAAVRPKAAAEADPAPGR